MSGNKKPPYIK